MEEIPGALAEVAHCEAVRVGNVSLEVPGVVVAGGLHQGRVHAQGLDDLVFVHVPGHAHGGAQGGLLGLLHLTLGGKLAHALLCRLADGWVLGEEVPGLRGGLGFLGCEEVTRHQRTTLPPPRIQSAFTWSTVLPWTLAVCSRSAWVADCPR